MLCSVTYHNDCTSRLRDEGAEPGMERQSLDADELLHLRGEIDAASRRRHGPRGQEG